MISIIFPAYNEKGNIERLYQRVSKVIDDIKEENFEIIFVDDNSSDGTPDIVEVLNKRDKRVKLIRFSRNFGSHAAIACGLNQINSTAAIVMAADLQDPPELIFRLYDEWKKGNKVVWGAREERKGEKKSKTLSAGIYYKLMNWLTAVKVPPSGADVFMIDKVVIDAFKKLSEKHSSVFMTIAWLGFKQQTISYVKEARHLGKSKWTLSKKFKLVMDSLLSFSDIPIRYMSVLGFMIAFLGFLYAVIVLYGFIFGSPVEGWSSLMVAILIIGGIQMITLGILGEYLWRTFDESRHRPRYIIEYTID